MRTGFIHLLRVGMAVVLALVLASCGKSETPQSSAKTAEMRTEAAVSKEKPAARGTDDNQDRSNEGAKAPTTGYGSGEKHKGELRLSEAETTQAGIVVEAIQPQRVAGRLVLTANIAANQNRMAHVAPRIEGRLIEVNANLGDRVKAGQALAVIDSIQMGEARAEYRRARSELKLSESAFQRADSLFREQVVPQRQWLEAKSAYERAQASAEAATERLRMLGGLPDTGESHFVVTAPFAGIVIEKKAVLGELAKSENSLFTVADLSTVWIEADVAEKDLDKLAVGAVATVTVSAFPDDVFKGRVGYIASVIDRQTRTVKARIQVPNRDGKLRLDMFAKAAVEFAESREALVLPQEAVVLLQGGPVVYVATDAGFEPRPVELGERLTGRVVIASGIKAGEKIVTTGAYALKSRQLRSQLGDSD
ncbi:MAG: efflux RND transporter periplasmic adaptor subunit [Burkholderiales bacterium]